MTRIRTLLTASALAAGALLWAGASGATTTVDTTVNAADDIYNASNPGSEPGNNPGYINVTGVTSITVSATGTITINGSTLNDPDGVGAATSSSSETGANYISGLTAPNGGYLTGVFLGSTVSTTTPTALNFVTSGTSFTSLSPLLQQSFFIGDGLTGDGTGTSQTFYVPTGATELYLGISDACGYNGSPGCYSDNFGTFDVAVTEAGVASAIPEPATWAVMLVGFAGLGGALRSRRRMAAASA